MRYYQLVSKNPITDDRAPVTSNGRRVLMLIDPVMVSHFEAALRSGYDLDFVRNGIIDKEVTKSRFVDQEPDVKNVGVIKPKILAEFTDEFGRNVVWVKNGEYAEPPWLMQMYYPEYYNHQYNSHVWFQSWPNKMRKDYNSTYAPHVVGQVFDVVAKGMSRVSWLDKPRGHKNVPGRIVGIYGLREFDLQPNEVIKAMDGYLYAVDERNGLARLLDKK